MTQLTSPNWVLSGWWSMLTIFQASCLQIDLIAGPRNVRRIDDESDVETVEIGDLPLDLVGAGQEAVDLGHGVLGIIVGFEAELLEDHAQGQHRADGVAVGVDVAGDDRRLSVF